MSQHSTLTSLFSDIADSIRAKAGLTEEIVADDFPEYIETIETGNDISDTTATASDVVQT